MIDWRTYLIAGLVSSCVAVIVVSGLPSERGKEPVYSDTSPDERVRVEAGRLISGEKVSVPIRFPAADEGMTVRSYSASCGCMALRDSAGRKLEAPFVIESGDNSQYFCRIDTAGKSGRSFFGVVAELVGSAATRKTEFQIFVDVVPGWISDPPSIHLRDLSLGDQVEAMAGIYTDVRNRDVLRIEEVEVRYPDTTSIEIIDRRPASAPSDQELKSRGLSYQGTVRIRIDVENFNDESVTIKGLGGAVRYRLPVHLHKTRSSLTVNPPVVYLNVSGEPKVVWIKSEKHKAPAAVTQLPDDLACEFVSGIPVGDGQMGMLQRFKVRVRPEQVLATNTATERTVRFSCGGEECVVRVILQDGSHSLARLQNTVKSQEVVSCHQRHCSEHDRGRNQHLKQCPANIVVNPLQQQNRKQCEARGQHQQ